MDTLQTTGTVSVARLALFFSWPSLMGEFPPASPWEGAPTPVSRRYRPIAGADADGVLDRFTTVLRESIDGVDHIAVLFSGGLDSSVVLWHTLAMVGNARRVTPVLVDAPGDDGRSSLQYAMRSLAALRLDLTPVVLQLPHDAELARQDLPEWSPVGPAKAPMPGTLQRALSTAAGLGAGVLLTGDGSDELLGTPRFMAGTLLRHRPSALPRYLRDCWQGTGTFAIAMETLAAACRLLPRSASMRLFLAACAPEICDPVPSRALAPRWRSIVERWSRQWLIELLELHTGRHRDWAAADIYDSFFPWEGLEHEPIRAPIRQRSPFLDDDFIEYALSLPPHQRFDPTLPSAYLRRKAIVSRLLPGHARLAFPPEKQTFRGAQSTHFRLAAVDPVIGREIGLIDSELDQSTLRPIELQRVAAVEQWLRGARAAGAAFDHALREPPPPAAGH